jgi:hypothetical protein
VAWLPEDLPVGAAGRRRGVAGHCVFLTEAINVGILVSGVRCQVSGVRILDFGFRI